MLKLLAAGISIYFIYQKAISRSDIESLWNSVSDIIKTAAGKTALVSVLLLMVLNWSLESLKWKLLLKRINPANFITAFRSVLSGVTISFFTPNRVGEFAGRVFHLEKGARVRSAVSSVIGSMNQLMITLAAGGAGLLISAGLFPFTGVMLAFYYMFIVLWITGVIILFFKIPRFARFLMNKGYFKNLRSYVTVFTMYPFSDLFRLTFLSSARYLVFVFQYVLLLKLFNVDIGFFDGIRIIAIVYLVMALIPTIALSEITIRSSVALYFLAPITGNSAGIIVASSALWLINLALPAVLGSFCILYFRLNK